MQEGPRRLDVAIDRDRVRAAAVEIREREGEGDEREGRAQSGGLDHGSIAVLSGMVGPSGP